jgi:hypothetical protein
MRDVLDNTWHDLREKRLWPIALVLVLAIVAIPLLLTKSAPQTAATVPVAPPTETKGQLSIALDDDAAASTPAGSSLDEFAENDPFAPPSAIAKSAGAGATATASLAGPTDGGTETGGGGTPSTGPSSPVEVAPPPVTRTETTEYQYVADVTFWNGDRRREIRGLRKLDMLPNQSAPILIFMGTSGGGGNAVFLVDSTLKAAGEGRCVPRAANCVYVHVGPGSEHAFSTEEGDSYRLRVNEIRRVKVDASASASDLSARASVGDGEAVRRFQLPALADLVAVTDTETTVPAASSSPKSADSSPKASGR